MAKHNKKRNIGIIYELLLRHISNGVIEEQQETSDKAMSIIKRHFKKDSELYKEFRLFNALVKTSVSSEDVASTILSEARDFVKTIDSKKLESEKTRLIHSINHNLQKETFYRRHVPDYRMYATIQTLMNDWKEPRETRNIPRMAEFESKVKNWLLKEKTEPVLEEMKSPDVDALVVRIMSEKLNKKYQDVLNNEQKEIIRSYVLFTSKNEEAGLREYLENLKSQTLSILNEYLENEDNLVLNEKADLVKKDLISITTENINDETIGRFLTVSHLKSTLLEEES